MPIRSILFDLGGVLLDFDHMKSCRALSKHCNFSPEDIYKKVIGSEEAKNGFVKDYEEGRMTSVEFFNFVRNGLSLRDIDYEDFKLIWGDIFFSKPEMEELIDKLKGSYRLVMFSNTDEIRFEGFCSKYPVVKKMDDMVMSWKVGAKKPADTIYKAGIKASQCRADECLLVDDVPLFVNKAIDKFGMRGAIFENMKKLERDFEANGIVF